MDYGVISVLWVHVEAEADVLAARGEHAFIGRCSAGQRIVGGVDVGPECAVHDQIEDQREDAAEEDTAESAA